MKKIKSFVIIFILLTQLVACINQNNDQLLQTLPVEEEKIITNEQDKINNEEINPYIFKVKNLSEVRMNKKSAEDYYIMQIGDSANLYYIDDENILWGCGHNQYGQLGQGMADNKFYENPVKIAEDVIHVDYSMKGFVIFLKSDGTLYGVGNNGTGALMQLDEFSSFSYVNGENYAVSSPRILMDQVTYARCGRDDVVALKMDNSVWTWGVSWYNGENYFFRSKPEKILEEVYLVTGGLFNHAALKADGTVWTWGYNLVGSCGINDEAYVSQPQQVAEHVKMVWTGQLYYNVDFNEISEADKSDQRALENTIIQKEDDSLWACGINIGEEAKIISPYYEAMEFETICTYEFYPCIIKE